MDAEAQAAGEKRVKRLLIDPLKLRGLAKPSGLKVKEFDNMCDSLCAKLAYMTDGGLEALEEQIAAHPGGKMKNQFPIANEILRAAAAMEPPSDSASPLMRKVFSSKLGLDALDGGWAPELHADLRRMRRWPGSYAVDTIKNDARDSIVRLENLNAMVDRGEPLSPDQSAWRDRRIAALQKCKEIAQLGQGAGA